MAVTLVQSTGNGSINTSSSQPTTLPSASTTGHTLVVAIHIYGGSPSTVISISSVTDGTNTFTVQAASQQINNSGPDYYMVTAFAYATAITGLSTETITANFSASCFNTIDIWELTASTYDQATHATGSSATPNAGALTPAANGAFAMAIANMDNGGNIVWTESSGWTLLYGGAAGGGSTASEYIAQTTASALSPSFTNAATGQWAASAIDFIPPGGAPDPTTLRTLSSPRLV